MRACADQERKRIAAHRFCGLRQPADMVKEVHAPCILRRDLLLIPTGGWGGEEEEHSIEQNVSNSALTICKNGERGRGERGAGQQTFSFASLIQSPYRFWRRSESSFPPFGVPKMRAPVRTVYHVSLKHTVAAVLQIGHLTRRVEALALGDTLAVEDAFEGSVVCHLLRAIIMHIIFRIYK
eukprot:2506098-Rhodomonas_salina.1